MRFLLPLAVVIAAPSHAFADDAELRKKDAIEASCNSQTLLEALECLRSHLSEDDHETVVNSSFDKLAMYHFGWGTGIRNSWGLWAGNTPISQYFRDLGVSHPDDMSGIIIDSYWLYFNDCDIQLDKQVAYYQAYWSQEDTEADETSAEAFSFNKNSLECKT
ncbi:DUF6794 domain-containing protein [Algimonas porphyrae]|uniref:DUF6794 domain-containing protein n=1 Tax=Algimonas porphyrae TaxID=1128113 RepID=A0ABQ5UVU0_9PROT|nr:DUF6794 domain-containing protein [Algimonas porphyrae]GLQ19391.1 hypothetical protein GCM10007854_03460 [Algimonas porphyrae]